MLRIQRAYEPPAKENGTRILVERLWPRGLTKERAKIDLWLKELAPSAALRQWFGHDPAKWREFCKRYERELASHRELVAQLASQAESGRVTLVFAARDATHNSALVLKQVLEKATRRRSHHGAKS